MSKNGVNGKNVEAGRGAVMLNDNRPESILRKKKIESGADKQPVQKKSNNTGLPDQLKSGIENLSGHSMDDVKVHYNSSQPAQLNAHAYAQGNQIHVAPGQEKHLPHEAWHVVQQKQGRVRPTKQLKGKTNINDDDGLEKEADVMGAKAAGIGPGTSQRKVNRPTGTNASNVAQLGRRERRKKEKARKKETQGRRQRFKKMFIDSKDPGELKAQLESKYKNDELAMANIKNAWRDAGPPELGKNILISDPLLRDAFTELMRSKRFVELVWTVIKQIKLIHIKLHITDTRWGMSDKTIYIKAETHNPTKESYMRPLLFEMNNAFHTGDFEEHNRRMKTVTRSKHGQGRARLRFGLNPVAFANAMEETEWKSAQSARAIGQEGVNTLQWDPEMVTYYKTNKSEHMNLQKSSGHYDRYVTGARRIQNQIRERRAASYDPDRLRRRFLNDTKLNERYGQGKVSASVETAIINRTLTDKAVMDLIKA